MRLRAPRALLLLFLLLAACRAPDPRAARSSAELQPSLPPRTFEEHVRELAAASQPERAHQRLEPLTGAWNVTVGEVGVDGLERDLARGRARIEWVHSGRFLAWEAELTGTGTTSGFLGYDLRQEQYQLLMITSLSSGMGVASGYGDLAGQGIRFTQETVDPESGRRLRMMSVLRLLERDHFLLDAYGVDAGGVERVVQRTHYRREKP